MTVNNSDHILSLMKYMWIIVKAVWHYGIVFEVVVGIVNERIKSVSD